MNNQWLLETLDYSDKIRYFHNYNKELLSVGHHDDNVSILYRALRTRSKQLNEARCDFPSRCHKIVQKTNFFLIYFFSIKFLFLRFFKFCFVALGGDFCAIQNYFVPIIALTIELKRSFIERDIDKGIMDENKDVTDH